MEDKELIIAPVILADAGDSGEPNSVNKTSKKKPARKVQLRKLRGHANAPLETDSEDVEQKESAADEQPPENVEQVKDEPQTVEQNESAEEQVEPKEEESAPEPAEQPVQPTEEPEQEAAETPAEDKKEDEQKEPTEPAEEPKSEEKPKAAKKTAKKKAAPKEKEQAPTEPTEPAEEPKSEEKPKAAKKTAKKKAAPKEEEQAPTEPTEPAEEPKSEEKPKAAKKTAKKKAAPKEEEQAPTEPTEPVEEPKAEEKPKATKKTAKKKAAPKEKAETVPEDEATEQPTENAEQVKDEAPTEQPTEPTEAEQPVQAEESTEPVETEQPVQAEEPTEPTEAEKLDDIPDAKDEAQTDEPEQPILRVEHLKKYFPIQTNFFGKPLRYLKAVDDITFDLKQGKTIGVVGESGCGKTTLGRTILKLYESDGGKIYFMGDDITNLKKRQMMKYRTDIQLIFQDPYSSLPPRMTVGAIIAEPVRVHKIVPKNEVYEYVIDIMKKCGLKPSYYDRYPHEFSGGQRQRICIARALAVKPKLVICDEPVSALDVSIQAQIINLLKDLQKTIGLTYVFISHDLSVVKYITDNILVMYLGNAMELSETDELFDNPLHPYTQALFSAVPAPNPNVKMNRIMLEGDIPSPANPPAGCKFHTRCSKCMKVCKYIIPEYIEVKPDHFVACHLYNEEIMNNLDKYDAEYDRIEEEKRIAIELAAQTKRGKKKSKVTETPDDKKPEDKQEDTSPKTENADNTDDTVKVPLNASVSAASAAEEIKTEAEQKPLETETAEPQVTSEQEATTEQATEPEADPTAETAAQAEEVKEEPEPQATSEQEAATEQATEPEAEQAEVTAQDEKPTKKKSSSVKPTEVVAEEKKPKANKSTNKNQIEPTVTIVTKEMAEMKKAAIPKSTRPAPPKPSAATDKKKSAKPAASSNKKTAPKTATSPKSAAPKTNAPTQKKAAPKSAAAPKSTTDRKAATPKSTTTNKKTKKPNEDKS